VILPDDRNEQEKITTILSDMDSEIDALTTKLNKVRHIKQGMMSELLTGRIRLVQQESAVTVMQPESKIIQFVPEKTKEKDVMEIFQPAAGMHNQHIDDAVMMAGIVDAFYSDKYPLGRKKVQKLMYLLRRHQGTSTSGFKEKAAGPYDEHLRYVIEPMAVKLGYIIIESGKKGAIFFKGNKVFNAIGYIREWEKSQSIQWLINQFRTKSVDELELLATVDRTRCVLAKNQKPISMQTVKEYIRNNDEWKDKLNRETFSDFNITRAINWSKDLFGDIDNAKD
jgi:type I restriction enzyme S subunit